MTEGTRRELSQHAAGGPAQSEEAAVRRVERGYLGVRISLYWSFSTRVVAATDMGITMLLMSKELSPRLLLIGCCWGGGRGDTVLSLYTEARVRPLSNKQVGLIC